VTARSATLITSKNSTINAVMRSANEIQKGFSPSSRPRLGEDIRCPNI
jgi:hypothetical protein